MYGNTAVETRLAQGQQKPVEQVSSINEDTRKYLFESLESLEQMLRKVRGSQPSGLGEAGNKVPERHLLADATELRGLASSVLERCHELHRLVGHDN